MESLCTIYEQILGELDGAVFHTNRSLALSCWWRTNGKNYPCSRRRQSDESCQYQDDSIGLDCLRTLFATQLVQASGKKHCRTPKPGDVSYQSVSFWPKKCVLVIHSTCFGFDIVTFPSLSVSGMAEMIWRNSDVDANINSAISCYYLVSGTRFELPDLSGQPLPHSYFEAECEGLVARLPSPQALDGGRGGSLKSQPSAKHWELLLTAPGSFKICRLCTQNLHFLPPSGTGLSINRK